MKSKLRSGKVEWILERMTGAGLLLAIPWLLLNLPRTCGLTVAGLSSWLRSFPTALLLILTLTIIALHAALGIRTVLTDYLTSHRRRSALRIFADSLILISALVGMASVTRLSLGTLP